MIPTPLNKISRREIVQLTGAPDYIVAYLAANDRLPVIHRSPGKGYPTYYHPDAIDIVLDHISKGEVADED